MFSWCVSSTSWHLTWSSAVFAIFSWYSETPFVAILHSRFGDWLGPTGQHHVGNFGVQSVAQCREADEAVGGCHEAKRVRRIGELLAVFPLTLYLRRQWHVDRSTISAHAPLTVVSESSLNQTVTCSRGSAHTKHKGTSSDWLTISTSKWCKCVQAECLE